MTTFKSFIEDKWYKDQPEWGTKESTKKAKKTTPGEDCTNKSTQVEEDVAGNNTSSAPVPDTMKPPKKKKFNQITKHYIEVMGKRRKQVK